MNDEKNRKQDSNSSKKFSRRDFMKTTGVAAGGIVGGSLLGGLVGYNIDDNSNVTNVDSDTASEDLIESDVSYQEARMYFKQPEDFEVLSAATEVIFPEDDNGPGSIGLGVPFYIDKQLASIWGSNGRMYMNGPFNDNEVPITKAELILFGIRGLQNYSQDNYDSAFNSLDENQQIEILEQFDSGDAEVDHISTSDFFELLRTLTLEGVYADPLYGGNRNMEGWKMKEYPGVQMSYRDLVDETREVNEEFVVIEPNSLSDY